MKFHRHVFSEFLKPGNIWRYNIIKHPKIINFFTPLKFTWIITAPFIFTQLDDLCVYAMISFAQWQGKDIV